LQISLILFQLPDSILEYPVLLLECGYDLIFGILSGYLSGDGGVTWLTEPAVVQNDLRGVCISKDGTVWAVGSGGVILVNQHGKWKVVAQEK